MSIAVVILVIVIVIVAGMVVASKMLARARASTQEIRPCYRCGIVATTDYMGLHYCQICRVAIVQMLPAVRHDPPYGFPGASGYLEFPEQELGKEEKKKEG